MGTWPTWGEEPMHYLLQTMKGTITSPVMKWGFATGYGVEWHFPRSVMWMATAKRAPHGKPR